MILANQKGSDIYDMCWKKYLPQLLSPIITLRGSVSLAWAGNEVAIWYTDHKNSSLVVSKSLTCPDCKCKSGSQINQSFKKLQI